MVLTICRSNVTILLRNHWLRDFKSKTSSISSNIILNGMLSSVWKKKELLSYLAMIINSEKDRNSLHSFALLSFYK